MVRPIETRPVGRYRIWLRYQDGTEGVVDLSHLAGKGVFAALDKGDVFAKVNWPAWRSRMARATSIFASMPCTSA